MRKIIVATVVALVLVVSAAVPVLAATSQDVTVTATPAFMSILNAPTDWDINDVAEVGGKTILPDTFYYSNPLGDATSPTVGGATDGECRFTITNTSTVAIDLTVTFPDHAGGDASTNSNADGNGATSFAAKSYFSGQASAAWVIAESSGSGVGYNALAATTDIKWGLIYESQSNDWTTGTGMSSTVNVTATAD